MPTDLDHFLSARWGLHTRWAGRTLYVPNTHEPWPVHDAEVVELDDDLMASVGLPIALNDEGAFTSITLKADADRKSLHQ